MIYHNVRRIGNLCALSGNDYMESLFWSELLILFRLSRFSGMSSSYPIWMLYVCSKNITSSRIPVESIILFSKMKCRFPTAPRHHTKIIHNKFSPVSNSNKLIKTPLLTHTSKVVCRIISEVETAVRVVNESFVQLRFSLLLIRKTNFIIFIFGQDTVRQILVNPLYPHGCRRSDPLRHKCRNRNLASYSLSIENLLN